MKSNEDCILEDRGLLFQWFKFFIIGPTDGLLKLLLCERNFTPIWFMPIVTLLSTKYLYIYIYLNILCRSFKCRSLKQNLIVHQHFIILVKPFFVGIFEFFLGCLEEKSYLRRFRRALWQSFEFLLPLYHHQHLAPNPILITGCRLHRNKYKSIKFV